MYMMVFDKLNDILRKQGDSTSIDDSEEKEADEQENIELDRPPGWKPLYGTYEKPVYTEDDAVINILSSAVQAADIANLDATVPSMGTNMEHIRLELETNVNDNGFRFLTIEVHIDEFSEWLPEEKGDYEYPERVLSNNGPYYMHLSNELEDIFYVPPFSFEFKEYNSDSDSAVYKYERELYYNLNP
jgi:hypothetical protein